MGMFDAPQGGMFSGPTGSFFGNMLSGWGDPEAQGAADASNAFHPALQAHFAGIGQQFSDWAQQQQAMNQRLQGQSLSQQALDPEGLQSAMSMALSTGPGAIKAYHGSPYDFDAFDASKIGTGEGAQAYGHGLYFADNPAVARNYRDKLSSPVTKNIDPHSFDPQDIAVAFYRQLGQRGGSMHAERMAQSDPANAAAYLKAADIMRSGDPYAGVSPGKMYEVNINADPQSFLDNDKSLAQQSPEVQAIIDRMRQQGGENLMIQTASPNPVGRTFYDGLSMSMPGSLTERDAAASHALNQAGIPGIRYLDQGSRASGNGTNNYVVFDPAIVQILRKYGLFAPLVGGAAVAGNQQ